MVHGWVSDPSQTVKISMVAQAEADKGEAMVEIADLVNGVYAEAEKGLWLDSAERTSAGEVAAMVRAGQLVVARMEGRLVGAVRVQRLDRDRGEFGMLVARPEHRGIGIGRELVAFAEQWAREHGFVRMQLELLVPRTWMHPAKEFLRGWYTRIGYRQMRIGRLDEAYPDLQPQLATPCDFVIYHKDL